MANKGRVYERLFERDFGYRTTAAFIYLPKQYKTAKANFGPWPGPIPPPQFFYSDVGSADYVNGVVTYNFPLPGVPGPIKGIRLEWRLSFTADFVAPRFYVRSATTDIFYYDVPTPLTQMPLLRIAGNVTHIPPYTGPITVMFVAFTERRWGQ